jgi:hypothetical protein
MLKSIDQLKNIQIVMVTYQPFEEMVAFYQEYHLDKYANIKIGRDTRFFFVPYYRIRDLPYMALYDAKGKLIRSFEGNTSIDKIVKAFDKKVKKGR